jgi:uncharacterized protein (DUF924 family)
MGNKSIGRVRYTAIEWYFLQIVSKTCKTLAANAEFSPSHHMEHTHVLTFWFDETDHKRWWQSDPDFDRLLAFRFGHLHRQASNEGLPEWRHTAAGCLAEIIVLDQFSRNIHRGTPAAFASDAQALALARLAINRGLPAKLPPVQRAFMYMPFMHSEDRNIHDEALKLFSEHGLEPNLAAETRHKAIIDRFGRYPHRNAILGRVSTAEEEAFLKLPGSSF